MMALTKDLKDVEKSLKQLTKKVEQVANKLASLEKAKPAKKPTARPKAAKKAALAKKATPAKKAAPKKPQKPSATDTVLNIVKRSKKTVDTASLKKKTGLKDNSIRAILSKLKKQGKIISPNKGVYAKA
jgi:predicted Rossmann fold nucleotide-binding protein DprA/Smf involved in DNA uptake